LAFEEERYPIIFLPVLHRANMIGYFGFFKASTFQKEALIVIKDKSD